MSNSSLKYALCIESIFQEMDFDERICHTIEAGYDAVEVWRVNEEKRRVLLDAKERGVRTVMLIGASGFATQDVAHRNEQLESLKRNIDLARELDCPNVCLFIGNRDPNLIYDQGRAAVLEFLHEAAGVLKGSGVTGIVESLSPDRHPKAFALSMRDVIAWVREISCPEIRLQFDVYHTAMTDPDVEALVRDSIEYTAYFQAADAPGCGQPGTGVLDFARILGAIQSAGFDGYFCWEYWPKSDAMESIRQARAHQI